ncbi:MAG: energy-coupling factor transporter transmembrane component T [Weeping tea tree witches'-broom phytoplasma]|nr:energy-coupling factor transporter transmembrane component T [Weeping tea tree witches'-broom phytoplasma]
MIDNVYNDLYVQKQKSFLYFIHPSVKIISIICLFKVVLGLDITFLSELNHKRFLMIFLYSLFVFIFFLFLFFSSIEIDISFIRLLKKISNFNFLIIFSLMVHLSLTRSSQHDIEICIWPIPYTLLLILIFAYILKKKINKYVYYILFFFFIFILPFLIYKLNFLAPNILQIFFLKPQHLLKILSLLIRILLILILFMLFGETTSFMEMNYGLENVLRPLKKIKFPLEFFSIVMSLIFMFIPFLLEETKKIIKAQMSRGINFYTKNILKKIYYLLSLLIPVFIISFRKSSVLANAMETRGYIVGASRTKLIHYKMTVQDYFVLCFCLLLCVWSFLC